MIPAQNVSFVSLGLVVLDEIRFPNRNPLTDVLGGSGAYAALGARLFLPTLASSALGWLLHIGNDFPEPTQELIKSWDATLITEKESSKPSTRGLLEYQDTTFGPKSFKYTTPVLQVQVSSLKDTPLKASKAYHFLEHPQDIKGRVADLLALREAESVMDRPLIIWEPTPPACKHENLQQCIDAASKVDVFSPNHLELAALFGEASSGLNKEKIESLALKVLDSGVGPGGEGTVIIRAGEHGCVVCTRHISPTWLPPFYISGDGHDTKVVDPTGAGNAFLGAFAIGYLNTRNAIEAACYGAVGASFALEQVGMPERSNGADGELWNGATVVSRLREYRQTIGLRGTT
ncbi:Ribokinase-like protein [Aspergillus californicus]